MKLKTGTNPSIPTSTSVSAVRTHIGFVLGHGSHGVLVCSKLHIGFSGHASVWTHLDVYAHGVQRGEELRGTKIASKYVFAVMKLTLRYQARTDPHSVDVVFRGAVRQPSHMHAVASCAREVGATVSVVSVRHPWREEIFRRFISAKLRK